MLLICLLAFLGSVLTFFSGFGLGTILLPAFALVFPLDISIALTGIVHLSNNLFKYFLVKKDADYKIIFRFGIPAIIAAWVGAWIMGSVSKMPELLSYYIGVNEYKIEPFKVIVGALIIFFTSLDYLPQTKTISFSARFLPIGGFLSGFFGGISGHQGALRSMFLLRSGMSKNSFIATGVVIACMIDMVRIPTYLSQFDRSFILSHIEVISLAIFLAFAGSFLGNRYLEKITLASLQKIVGISLMLIGAALILGII